MPMFCIVLNQIRKIKSLVDKRMSYFFKINIHLKSVNGTDINFTTFFESTHESSSILLQTFICFPDRRCVHMTNDRKEVHFVKKLVKAIVMQQDMN